MMSLDDRLDSDKGFESELTNSDTNNGLAAGSDSTDLNAAVADANTTDQHDSREPSSNLAVANVNADTDSSELLDQSDSGHPSSYLASSDIDANTEDVNTEDFNTEDFNTDDIDKDENVSEDGSNMEGEALGKTQLSQGNDFLDDPSQFYFDDDLPTPELSSNENSNDKGVYNDEHSNLHAKDDEDNIGEDDNPGDHIHSSNVSVESEEETIEEEEADTSKEDADTDDEVENLARTESDNEEERDEDSQSGDEHPKEEIEEEEDDDGSIIMDDYDEEDRELSLEDNGKREEDNEELEENEEAESRDESVEDDNKSVGSEEIEEEEEEEGSKEMSVEDGTKRVESEEEENEDDSKNDDETVNDLEGGMAEKEINEKDNEGKSIARTESATKEIKEESGVKDTPKIEAAVETGRKMSTRSQSESSKQKISDKTGFAGKTNDMKQDPESCAGLVVTKTELDQIRLKKDLMQGTINTIDKFLNTEIKSKIWREGEELEELKANEIHSQRRKRQRRLTESEVVERIAGKRKYSEEIEIPVKKDGRGRPKGYRVKKEVEEAPEDVKPVMKRRKKDEMLLMKALDEEMFKMDEESNKEMERISQGLDYQCSVCSQVFIEKKNLSKHFFKCLMKFTQSGKSAFKCAICFEYFSLLGALESHVERKHDGICEEPFQCSQCSQCFEQGSSLKAHVLETHEVFQCVYCEKYYRSQHTLDVHVNKKHAQSSGAGPSHKIVTTNTRGKVRGEAGVQLTPEPVDNQVRTNVVRIKKLGRPFKRNTSDGVVVKTEPVESLATEAATSGDDTELGRGRRVKKKKALDYEDSILVTTPGRRARKSIDTTEHNETKTVNNIMQELDRIKGELDEISHGNAMRTQQRNIPQPRVLHQPRILPQPRPQPRLLHQPVLDTKPNWKVIPGFQNKDKCSQGTNTASPDYSESVSQIIDEVIGNGVRFTGEKSNASEPQPIEQAVETSTYLNRKVHLCPKCRKPFPNKFLVKLHLKRRHNIFKKKTVTSSGAGEHPSGENGSTTGEGGRSGQGRGRTRSKPPVSVHNRENLFKCVYCDASFSTFNSLEDHYLNDHQGIPCNVCKISIKNRMLLDKHMNACHSAQERYVCPVCDKRLKSKETLRKHIAMHEDRRPYDCYVCKRSFRYTYDMRLHWRRTHPREWQSFMKAGGDEEVTGTPAMGDSPVEGMISL